MLDFAGVRGDTGLGLLVEPLARRRQHENQDQNHRQIVLPRAALVGPEKRAR
jgi:hypothetical protein